MRRYEHLLAEARHDRACLLVGQHAGDQAETVMMRLARGSGLAGLAGMRPVAMESMAIPVHHAGPSAHSVGFHTMGNGAAPPD